jgi:RNA polymerase sigma-70 factor (ECF subfamily)
MSQPLQDQDRDIADMKRLAGGQDGALNELMARHGPKLFKYLIRCLQNEEDAADIAQETFVRIYQHRSRFDSRQRFSTWLYSIATNLSRDRFRWRSRHPTVSLQAEDEHSGITLLQNLPDPEATPSQRMERDERAEAVRKAVAALPEELRIPLLLVEYEGLSQVEIATILKCSAKAVEMRLYRARTRLREELQGIKRDWCDSQS